jgi:hypothetical protein
VAKLHRLLCMSAISVHVFVSALYFSPLLMCESSLDPPANTYILY